MRAASGWLFTLLVNRLGELSPGRLLLIAMLGYTGSNSRAR
jgi:hypothetical protein